MAGLTPVRVVVADDHPIWISGVAADLGENFDVVASAGDAVSAIAAIEKHHPDLVLSDLHMPEGGGRRVAMHCGARVPVVILSVSEAESDVLEAVAVGAVGYLLKSTSGEELRTALWRAAQGEPVFSPSLASLVLTEFRRLRSAAQPAQGLSEREREVLQYVARGRTYKEIGEALFISPKTVENHTRNILGKLHLSRKDELMRYAIEHGIE